MSTDISRLDLDLVELVKQVARTKFQDRMKSLDALLAHPDTPGKPAPAGELAEYRHLLYDADEDAVTPAFPYPTAPKETP